MSPPTPDELRAGIGWVDGHADVWRLFADAELFGRGVHSPSELRPLLGTFHALIGAGELSA